MKILLDRHDWTEIAHLISEEDVSDDIMSVYYSDLDIEVKYALTVESYEEAETGGEVVTKAVCTIWGIECDYAEVDFKDEDMNACEAMVERIIKSMA